MLFGMFYDTNNKKKTKFKNEIKERKQSDHKKNCSVLLRMVKYAEMFNDQDNMED